MTQFLEFYVSSFGVWAGLTIGAAVVLWGIANILAGAIHGKRLLDCDCERPAPQREGE